MKLALGSVVVVAMMATACGRPLQDFRDAAPSSQNIDVKMRSAKGQALVGDPAVMPGVTAVAAFLVNGSVALVLGRVGEVVRTEPNTLSATEADWGPVSKPLWANEYTLHMTRDADGFHYVGQARPRGGGDFVTIITGDHKFTATGSQGSFTLDLTAMQDLANPPHDVGEIVVDYTHNRKTDVSLEIHFNQTGPRNGTLRTDSVYTFSQEQNGDGHLEFVVDSNYVLQTSAMERLSIKSRWHWDGSGRADIVGSEGDIATPAQMTECWDTAHARTYYGDTLNLFPTEGVDTDCAFSDASFSRL